MKNLKKYGLSTTLLLCLGVSSSASALSLTDLIKSLSSGQQPAPVATLDSSGSKPKKGMGTNSSGQKPKKDMVARSSGRQPKK